MPSNDILLAERIAREVSRRGGRVLYVGGLVRDRLMGLPEDKDVDIEVYGLSPDELRDVLAGVGDVYMKGASFGVFGLRHSEIDVAMPRQERCTGRGHRDFSVYVDPFLPVERAAARRDFTVNAILQDVLTGEIIDPFDGRSDLRRGVLRHVTDQSFPEDPLRVFRAAQFAARFEFAVADETMALMQTIDVSQLSHERVFSELEKALLRAAHPSLFFDVLQRCGQLGAFFPEIQRMRGVEQNPRFHPEGDVWIHTMQVLDQAAALRDQAKHPLYFMLSALMHDLGKVTSSQVQDDGRITSYMHPEAGVPLAEQQLRRLTSDAKLIAYVLNMVLLHMRPCTLAAGNSRPKKTRMMFDASVCPEDLILLARADAFGCGDNRRFGAGPYLEERLRDYYETIRQPMVTGQDLIRAGYRPGEQFRDMLNFARQLHFSGQDKAQALKQLMGEYPLE
ncbi:MAG: HD domain-containing protein [Clostridia bacterium]|nr:HD domain-containing protein [Clostridia bacterium]